MYIIHSVLNITVKKYFPTDEYTVNLLNGYMRSACNHSYNETFIRRDGDNITATTRQDIFKSGPDRILEQFYYRPGYYPRVTGAYADFDSSFDAKLVTKFQSDPVHNTVWQNWSATSNWLQYNWDGTHIIEQPIEREPISISEYEEIFIDCVTDKLQELYGKGKPVVLCYSGSIDSAVILSFIIKLGLLNKTKIVHCINSAIKYPKRDLSIEQQLGLSVDVVEYNWDMLVSVINQHNPTRYKDYTDCHFLDIYPDSYMIGGWGGNKITLHHPYGFIKSGSKFKVDPSTLYAGTDGVEDGFHNSLAGQTWLINEDYDCIHQADNMVIESGLEVDRFIRIFSSSDKLINAWKNINYTGYTAEYFADAQFAKNIIVKNSGPDLLLATRQRSSGDGSLPKSDIPINLIDPEYLKINFTKRSNPVGTAYLKRCIAEAFDTGYISCNTIMSLKWTNWLS